MIFTDPPSTPIISGYTEGSVIPAGSSQKLLCMSSGGNPPPTLNWFKNDKKVNRSWLSYPNSSKKILYLASCCAVQIVGEFQLKVHWKIKNNFSSEGQVRSFKINFLLSQTRLVSVHKIAMIWFNFNCSLIKWTLFCFWEGKFSTYLIRVRS